MTTSAQTKSQEKQPKTGSQESGRSSEIAASDGTISKGKRQLDEQVTECPLSMVALGFIAGAGKGTIVGSMLFDSYARSRANSAGLLERVSSSVSEAVSKSIPEPLKRS